LLPELSELKRFSQVASLHCIYHIVRGEQEIAFEYAKLGFRLIQITNSDILMSRLVQIAQTIFALEALNAAQTYHAWTDAQWQELESILDTYDFLPLLPASIRCDRAIAFDTMEPMISKSGLESIKAWEDFLDPEQKSQQKNTWSQPIEEIFFKDMPQAFYAKHWRLCLEGYSRMIGDLDQLSNHSKTTPWNLLLEKRNKEEGIWRKTGLFSYALHSGLGKIHYKFMKAQIRIQVTQTSIALERHFLKHHSYPVSLQELKNEFPNVTINDPMTGAPLKYQRTDDGYEIYSVGLNSKDENGMSQQTYTRSQGPPPDDILWAVGEQTKQLPPATLPPKTANNARMDAEMMKRYGLIPIENNKETSSSNGEDKEATSQ
jgi:hypothetical protein